MAQHQMQLSLRSMCHVAPRDNSCVQAVPKGTLHTLNQQLHNASPTGHELASWLDMVTTCPALIQAETQLLRTCSRCLLYAARW
jgi:hypothetical protein